MELKLNINKATKEELMKLPDFTEDLTRCILDIVKKKDNNSRGVDFQEVICTANSRPFMSAFLKGIIVFEDVKLTPTSKKFNQKIEHLVENTKRISTFKKG
jgi:hypothetical protein